MAYKTKYNPKNKSKYIGNPTKIICRSLWERRVCKYLDENKNIIRWGSEEIAIPYYSPVDKKVHRYYPDFIVEKKTPNGVETLIIEVKPKKQTMEPERKKKKKSTYIKECMTYLKKDYSIALMIDQRVSEGKRLPFFNRNALTTTIPAQIALKYKYDIVPIYIVRKKNNEFEMEVYTPINVSNLDNSEKNKIDISLKLNNIIEEMIRKEPWQWIWTHNRWK